MQPYADESYYSEQFLGTVTDNIKAKLIKASHQIDSLTFSRIRGIGFENMTQFQQTTIKEVCCQMVDFEEENHELIESVLSSYTLNGVSMAFGNSWNVVVKSGVAMKRSTYQLLSQTGLTRQVI